jgi:hypothetical protein
MGAPESFGPVVYSYSRARAIDDGVLVDVTPTAKEAGIRLHTVVSRTVWDCCVEVPSDESGPVVGQDERGRLWDGVNLTASWIHLVQLAGISAERVDFSANVRGADHRLRTARLYAHVGHGDSGEPVLTIMEDGEDRAGVTPRGSGVAEYHPTHKPVRTDPYDSEEPSTECENCDAEGDRPEVADPCPNVGPAPAAAEPADGRAA